MNTDLFAAGDIEEAKSARLSPDRVYRYELWRRWKNPDGGTRCWGDVKNPFCLFIGLNPSTADETKDDPTIRKCVGFATRWGFEALCMVNLFAFRATSPKVMKAETFPVGHDNDRTLFDLSHRATWTIAAWGNHGLHQGRCYDLRVLSLTLKCLRVTKSGMPEHPLYVPYEIEPKPYTL